MTKTEVIQAIKASDCEDVSIMTEGGFYVPINPFDARKIVQFYFPENGEYSFEDGLSTGWLRIIHAPK